MACAVLAAAGPARAGTEFTFGHGEDADIAVDAAGNAHVAWENESSDPETIRYCRIPRGARACDIAHVLADSGVQAEDAHVLISPAGHVVVVLGAYSCVRDTAMCTMVRRSTDGGMTFEPAKTLVQSEAPAFTPGGAVYGPGDSVSFVTSGGNVRFVNAPLAGEPVTQDVFLEQSNPSIAAVGLAGDTPVVVWDDISAGAGMHWNVYNGSAPLNDPAAWSRREPIGPQGDNRLVLAGGPTGLFLLYGLAAPTQYFVRKFTGSGWTDPVAVSPAGSFGFPDLHQDGSGRLHVVFVDFGAHHLLWRTSTDGLAWSDPIAINVSDALNPRMTVAAAPDGQGFAAWDSHQGDRLAYDLRAIPLEQFGEPPVDPCQPAGCAPTGGAPATQPPQQETLAVQSASNKDVSAKVEIESCRRSYVRSRVKFRKRSTRQGFVLTVKKVVFRLDRHKPKTDADAPYAVKLPLPPGTTPDSRHRVTATVHYTVKRKGGKARVKTLTITKRFRLCPPA